MHTDSDVAQIAIAIPPEDWRTKGSDSDPTSSLIAKSCLTICGLAMHLEAYAVAYRPKTNEMYFVEDPSDESIGRIWTVTGSHEPFDTTKINGREYVIIAYPHS